MDHFLFFSRLLAFPLTVFIPALGKLLRRFNFEEFDADAMNFLVSGLDRAMQERKGRENEYNDFVSLLLKAEIPEEDAKGGARGLSTEEMMAQAFIFMLAGYDTTSSALTTTAYLLAQHPEHQERCREEVLSEFEDESPVSVEMRNTCNSPFPRMINNMQFSIFSHEQ